MRNARVGTTPIPKNVIISTANAIHDTPKLAAAATTPEYRHGDVGASNGGRVKWSPLMAERPEAKDRRMLENPSLIIAKPSDALSVHSGARYSLR